MFHRILIAAAAAASVLLGTSAQATQFDATGGIFDGSGYGSSYTGAGGTTPLSNQALGEVVDGGNGAFDAFGYYNDGTAGLVQERQVELLSGNLYRFFDTFTNIGAQTVATTLNFFGNLGSDGDELVLHSQGGLIVSCEDDLSGQCGSDPVLALVSGNNGLGQAMLTPDRYNVAFQVQLAPGQSLSLLNFAFLASGVDGPTAQDVVLAQTTGQALLHAPRLEGLTDAQRARVLNFSTSPVPEPASLVLMLGGLAAFGWRARRAA